MTEAAIIDLTVEALVLVLLLSLPPIAIAALVGVMVSLVQALTQVQEQTISFGLKLVAVFVTLIVIFRWVGAELYLFTRNMFDSFPFTVS